LRGSEFSNKIYIYFGHFWFALPAILDDRISESAFKVFPVSYPFADFVRFLWEIFTFNFYFFLGWLKKRGHNNKKMLKEIVESEDDESIRADYL